MKHLNLIFSRTLRVVGCVAALVCLFVLSATAADAAKQQKWTPLFNGKNLDGWKTYLDEPGKNSDPDRVLQIHDGVIHVYKDHADGAKAAKGYFATEAQYSHYHLRFQYKWGTKKFAPRYEMLRDAGLLYHITGPDKVWPRCIECQVQEGDTGDCLTVRGTQLETFVDPKPVKRDEYRCRDAADGGVAKTLGTAGNIRFIKQGVHETEGWNSVEIIVRGSDETVHIVNGHPTFKAKKLCKLGADDKTWEPLAGGHIAFQAECAEVLYRNIEIQPLDSGPLQIVASDVTAPTATTAPVAFKATPPANPAPLPQVPEGFEISLVAAPPLVDYPTLACFDDEGRLYVSEGANVNDEHHITSKTLPRSIRRLEDTDGDGRFDRHTVFADKMVFPYGGVWHDGTLYVASDPTLWRLEDTDGDGVADKRDVVITGFGAIGHASCVKGGYLGPDGWIYFCGGNDAGYDITDRDGKRLKDPKTAPCVFRIRPNGTGLEYFANGAAGVYDLCFDPSGDLFGIVTILRYPRGDGLMHWVYGGCFESSRPTSRYAKLTGGKLPALHDWPQTSPSGALQYQSSAFGDEYRGNIFTAHFGTHDVTRSVVERNGASWKWIRDEKFAFSSNLNCRFTDVLEDADGSLLLVNTGGWFRIGCPTSEVGEGDLRGSIYRVRKIGQKSPADPRGLKIDWKSDETELAKLLDDPRFVVRERAIGELTRRGTSSLPALRAALRQTSAEARRNAVWTLTRIDHADARAAVREALSDSDLSNKLAALNSVGLWRDKAAFDQLVGLLKSDQPAIVRESATALGRIGSAACVPALLEQLANTSDRFLEQALIFALIEIDSREPTAAGLNHKNPKIQRGALLALDQMPSGQLGQSDVAPLLRSDNFALQKAALQVLGRHSGWTAGLVEFSRKWLKQPELSPEQQELVATALSNGRNDRAVQNLIGETLAASTASTATQLLLLEVMDRGRPKRLPDSWQKSLAMALESTNEPIARQAIATISHIAKSSFADQLQSQALNTSRPPSVRIEAAAALADGNQHPGDKIFEFLLDQCASRETEVVHRLAIARALGNAKLTAAQLDRMTRIIASAGALELPSILTAYEEAAAPVAGEKLFAALINSPGTKALSPVRLQKLVERYPKSDQLAAAGLLKQISAGAQSQAARMKELELCLTGGDPARGQGLFAGKAACSQCHKIDNEGSKIGPDLSQIGAIRTRRDLVEAIAFPSATFARGFEPVSVIVNGRPLNGVLARETAREVYLMTADRSTISVPRDDIEDIIPSRISIMPQGLDRNLTPEELRDLVAYLSSRGGEKNAGTSSN